MLRFLPMLMAWQWTPDLIWFDNLKSFGTANYYVQKLFSNNKGTKVLNMLQENKPLTGQQGLYATAALDEESDEIILKLVNTTPDHKSDRIVLQTSGKVAPKANMTVLKSDDPGSYNTIEIPEAILPVRQEFALKDKKFDLSLAPYSVTVMRIKLLK